MVRSLANRTFQLSSGRTPARRGGLLDFQLPAQRARQKDCGDAEAEDREKEDDAEESEGRGGPPAPLVPLVPGLERRHTIERRVEPPASVVVEQAEDASGGLAPTFFLTPS